MEQINNILINVLEFSRTLIFSFLFSLFLFNFIGNEHLGDQIKEFFKTYYFISKHLGDYKNISKNNLINNIFVKHKSDLQNNVNFTVSSEDKAKILKELDQQTPDWKNDFNFSEIFINSPLESNNSLTQFVLDALNNHLIINFVTVYLLLMLLIILICKFIFTKDIKFNRLEKYPLGIYISKFLIKYISIWQKIGNFWIFIIIISLIFFNTVITYSTYHLILLLQ